MRIAEVRPQSQCRLFIVADDGRAGNFDVTPYLDDEAFKPLRNPDEFAKVANGGYFIAWDCGADLSADTLEARWELSGE